MFELQWISYTLKETYHWSVDIQKKTVLGSCYLRYKNILLNAFGFGFGCVYRFIRFWKRLWILKIGENFIKQWATYSVFQINSFLQGMPFYFYSSKRQRKKCWVFELTTSCTRVVHSTNVATEPKIDRVAENDFCPKSGSQSNISSELLICYGHPASAQSNTDVGPNTIQLIGNKSTFLGPVRFYPPHFSTFPQYVSGWWLKVQMDLMTKFTLPTSPKFDHTI